MLNIFLIVLNIKLQALAEYRAFELKITNVASGKSRSVKSTLDQFQYSEYYPLNAGESIEYVTSWMCMGNTNHHKAICANPQGDTTQNQNPASPDLRTPALQTPAVQ